jgi:hypothetical protein
LIEWLSSKVAVGVAVLVLTASVVGFFAYERSAQFERDVGGCARSLARYIESFSALAGEASATVTVGEGGNLELPAAIQGKAVTMNVSGEMVIARCGGSVATERLASRPHLWHPSNASYDSTEMSGLDGGNRWTGERGAGASLVLERKFLTVSGQHALHTFCYPVP